jgi:hypothetical protein
MKNNGEILAEHYQKTYELTLDLWKERNRIFLALVAVIGAATILTFNPANANPLLALWAGKALGVADTQGFGKSFPFGLVQSILLVVVFYLTVNLYHRALAVGRNYQYLGDLENEIREQLGSEPHSVAFTREGTYYWQAQKRLQKAVKWCFILLVGSLLFAFLGGRTYNDFKLGKILLALVDMLFSFTTGLFFVAYAMVSVSLDRPNRAPKKQSKPLAKSKSA